MLTLKEIFNGHNAMPVDRVVLFEDDLWCIYERIPVEMNDRFNLIHRCGVGTFALHLPDEGQKPYDVHCRGCMAVPSDGIVGLLKLHKWGMGDTNHDY